MDISVFQGADQLQARAAMAEEINDRLRQLLKTKVTQQMVRRSPLQSQHAIFIFMVDVTIVNQEAKAHTNLQQAMRGLTRSGGSLRTLTAEMVNNWESLATTGEASHPGAPRILFTLEPRSNVNMENIAHSAEHTPQQLIHTVRELYNRAEEGSPLKASTIDGLSGRLAIFASYVPGNTGPTTTLFCLEPELLTNLILRIGTLGLMQGSWTSQTVADPRCRYARLVAERWPANQDEFWQWTSRDSPSPSRTRKKVMGAWGHACDSRGSRGAQSAHQPTTSVFYGVAGASWTSGQLWPSCSQNTVT